MNKTRLIYLFTIVTLSLVLFNSCDGGTVKSEPPKNILPDEKDFTGIGSASKFSETRNNAYIDVIKKAIIFILGDEKFNQNQSDLEKVFFSYPAARKYILGETEKTSPDKEKKWLSNTRDANGNLVLKLQAFVNIKKLKGDLESMSLQSGRSTGTTASQASEQQPGTKEGEPGGPLSEDLKGVDVSSLTFLVYYNSKDPALKNDSEQETYSRWSVDNLNRELSSLNIQTFDLETVEKLAGERSLLQESTTGNIGVGLLLAQKVYAELYAEVSPAVSYQGNRANVILNTKVFVRTTGALIASIEKGGQQYESTSLQASIKMSMREAAKKVKEDLIVSLKKYINNGRFYFVRLTGVQSFKDAVKFSTTIGKMNGAASIVMKSGSKEDMVYDFNLQFKGNPTEAVSGIIESLSVQPGFEKIDLKEIRGNELTFSID